MKGYNTVGISPAQRAQTLATLCTFPFYPPLKNNILNKYCLGEELLLDLFWLFYSGSVKILPMQQTLDAVRLNFLALNRLVEDGQIQRLRLETEGDKVKAFFAALEVLNTLLAVLPKSMFDVAKELSQSHSLLERHERQKEFVQKAFENIPAEGSVQVAGSTVLQVMAWKSYLAGLSRRCEELRSKRRSLIAQLMAQWYSGQASELMHYIRQQGEKSSGAHLESSQKAMQKAQDLLISDNAQGNLRRVTRLSASPKLQAIANRALSIKPLDFVQCHGDREEEVHGICSGNTIDLVSMEQWASFFDSKQRKRIYLQFVEQQLWMLELSNPYRPGGLVVCVDCSGSMRGINEEIAKAIAVCLLNQACQVQRDCLVVLFGDRNTTKVIECPGGKHSTRDLLDIAYTFFNTKTTDFTRALEEALGWILSRKTGQSDLLVISDGLGSVGKEIIDKTVQEEQNGRLFSWVVIVGKDTKGQEDIKSLSERVLYSSDLLSGAGG